jgi:hypothetical protein
MSYYIGTEEQCEAYNHLVSEGEGYQDSTVRWAQVRQHPSGSPFAIKVKGGYDAEDMELVNELSEDWFPEIEEI